LVGVRELYLSRVVRKFDGISRVVSCGCRKDSAVFVFMIFMTQIEVLVQFLFIELIVVHDLKEFLKFLDEVVIVSRILDNPSKTRRVNSAKELVAFIIAPNNMDCSLVSKPPPFTNTRVTWSLHPESLCCFLQTGYQFGLKKCRSHFVKWLLE
jgi:hypothetical protein